MIYAIGLLLIFIILESAAIIALLYTLYKYNTDSKAELTFEECISILQLIVNSELQAYEKDVFLSKGSITNSNFENYYNDITKKVISNLSESLVYNFTYYINEDALYLYIARAVKSFLVEKISGTV